MTPQAHGGGLECRKERARHDSARSPDDCSRRAHHRGVGRRAGRRGLPGGPALPGLLLLRRLPGLPGLAGISRGGPGSRRPHRHRRRALSAEPHGARGVLLRALALRGGARWAALHRRSRAPGLHVVGSAQPLRRYFAVSAVMLAVRLLVFAQNPAATPNRNFLIYMCLWAVSNVAVPEAVLGTRKHAAILLSFVPPLLCVHGWIFFLTYPVNPARQAWLERHRVGPRLYRAALAAGVLMSLVFVVVYLAAPGLFVNGWLYPASVAFQFTLAAVSFPVKIVALLDTRRRAASPLVNQQITVLILGIGLGLGCWLTFMLGPLIHYYPPPVDPQVGSALVLLYPLAIAYATVRYRLFDATVVIRRSLVYTMLAGLITGAYALLLAAANALLARSELTRSPWFSAGFMFVVALAFNPLRESVRRAVDRTFL